MALCSLDIFQLSCTVNGFEVNKPRQVTIVSRDEEKGCYTLFFNKNVVFPDQAEYSYFSADFKLKIFLYYS